MMSRVNLAFGGLAVAALALSGCMAGLGLGGILGPGTDPTVAATAAKADDVARRIGGTTGFGGEQMDGYRGHFGQMMGFDSAAHLADPSGETQIQFHNDSDEECTFHLTYAASHMGLEDQTVNVTVAPGETMMFDGPCAEIIGLGSLEDVGTVACELGDGRTFGNEMAVPGFMNADYFCGGEYDCFFGPDIDDVDGDGDTDELIATTAALHEHLGPGGMMGHGPGMGHGR